MAEVIQLNVSKHMILIITSDIIEWKQIVSNIEIGSSRSIKPLTKKNMWSQHVASFLIGSACITDEQWDFISIEEREEADLWTIPVPRIVLGCARRVEWRLAAFYSVERVAELIRRIWCPSSCFWRISWLDRRRSSWCGRKTELCWFWPDDTRFRMINDISKLSMSG